MFYFFQTLYICLVPCFLPDPEDVFRVCFQTLWMVCIYFCEHDVTSKEWIATHGLINTSV